jgi:putative cofactor-binding repeat protein
MAQFRTDKNIIDSGQVFTRYEIMMLTDRLTPSGTAVDAFGRMRVAQPHTLFDSQHQDVENDKWDTLITGSGTKTHLPDESTIKLEIATANNDSIIRETLRTMPYQPGKSLLIMNTFAMGIPKANVVQRTGYFSSNNGIYLENDSGTNYLVLRSSVTGNIIENRVPQSEWNIDKFDGNGYSGQGTEIAHKTGLDVNKSNLLWLDIEWLGVGDVRCGFLVDGLLKTAHVFHHDNRNTTTYMRSAILPLRYEIFNKGVTTSNTAMRQICSTVISEGGYSQINQTRSASTPLTGKNLTNGINNPMVSVRLKTNRLNAVAIPVSVDLYGLQATAFKYRVYENVTSLANASWTTTDTSSAVEYDLSATSMTGGVLLKEGIFKGLESAKEVSLRDELNGIIQLTRKINAANGDIFTIAIQPTTNNDDAIVALSWQEHIN